MCFFTSPDSYLNDVGGMVLVPCSTMDEMNAAVASAKEAYKTWSKTSVMARQGVMFKYQELIKKHLKDIAGLITIGEINF